MALLAGLSQAIDARPYMRGHAARVARLAELLALRLGWGGDRLALLRVGAQLHDVGKLAVPDEVLRKPGRLNEQELAEIRRHPAAGVRLLRTVGVLRPALPHVLYHHERWDGKGYPSRRAGAEIPLEARILAIADAYDAMTSARPYCAPLSAVSALAEIERCAGSQFDPYVARVFLDAWQDRPAAAAG